MTENYKQSMRNDGQLTAYNLWTE